MPVGRLDHPVRWLLWNSNMSFARPLSSSVARNAFAAARTLGVTLLLPDPIACGDDLRCAAEPIARSTNTDNGSHGTVRVLASIWAGRYHDPAAEYDRVKQGGGRHG